MPTITIMNLRHERTKITKRKPQAKRTAQYQRNRIAKLEPKAKEMTQYYQNLIAKLEPKAKETTQYRRESITMPELKSEDLNNRRRFVLRLKIKPFPFLKLPLELRTEIFEYCSCIDLLVLTRLCRQIYFEINMISGLLDPIRTGK
ncbi:hypothetical protein BJ508DRAFT_373210, partial [Ascobolus immersus RN42]